MFSLYTSEKSGNSDIRDRKEEFRIFCSFKVLALPMKGHSDIGKWICISRTCILQTRGQSLKV